MVWVAPTSLVAVSGLMLIFASTHVLWASGPSPVWLSPVARVRVTPPAMTDVLAWMVEVPAVALVNVIVHVPPVVVQLGVPAPWPVIVRLTVVPSVGLTQPAP